MFAGRRFPTYAIGRKSPFERKFAVPLGSFTGIVIFGHFTCLQPSFRVAGVADKSPFERKFAVPLGSFTGVVLFGHFTCLQPSFRVAGVS